MPSKRAKPRSSLKAKATKSRSGAGVDIEWEAKRGNKGPEQDEDKFKSSIYGNYIPEENHLTSYIDESQSASSSSKKKRPARKGTGSPGGGQGVVKYNEYNMPIKTRVSTAPKAKASTPRSPYPQKLRNQVSGGDNRADAQRPSSSPAVSSTRASSAQSSTMAKYQDPRMLELLLKQVTQRLRSIEESRKDNEAAMVARVEHFHDTIVEQHQQAEARSEAQDKQHESDRKEWTELLNQQRETYATHHEFFKQVKLESHRWRKADELVIRLENAAKSIARAQRSIADDVERVRTEREAMDKAAKEVRADRAHIEQVAKHLDEVAQSWKTGMEEHAQRAAERDTSLTQQIESLSAQVQAHLDEVLTKKMWRKHVDEVLRNRKIEHKQWKKRQEAKEEKRDQLVALVESRMATAQWKDHLAQLQRYRVLDAKQRRERQVCARFSLTDVVVDMH